MIAFSANELVWRFGWMLLHSLWQIALIGLLLWLVLLLTRKRSANLRYGIACCGLAVCYLPLVYSFTHVSPNPEAAAVSLASSEPVIPQSEAFPVEPDQLPVSDSVMLPDGYFDISENDPTVSTEPGVFSLPIHEGKEQTSLLEQSKAFLTPWITWLVGLWAIGAGLLTVWNVEGWLLVQRLRRQGTPVSSDVVRQRAKVLLDRMQIGRAVRFLESMVVEIPVVIGWLRPVVLLPAGLLTSLTPEQLEAVIAHELAHICRQDYLVNLLQTMTESLLFYHPVIWWLSRRIRVEREYCCDDEAIAACGDRSSYVCALAAVETSRTAPAHALSLAGTRDGSTLSRMRRLMGVPHAGSQGWIAGLSTITLLFCLGLAVSFSQKPERPEPLITPDEPVAEAVSDAQVQQKQAPVKPRKDEFKLDPETFQLEVSYYGESDKPFYDFTLRHSPVEFKRTTFHLVERTDDWKENQEFALLLKWLRLSGFFEAADLVDASEPPVRKTPTYVLRVTSGDKVWEEDLGFHLGMLLRLESLQRVLTGFGLNSDQAPNFEVGIEPLLSRLSGYKKIWMEGQLVSDLKLQVISQGNQFPAGSAVPIKIQLQNTGNKPQNYEQHILSLVPSSIYIFNEYGRRVPYVGGTSQIQSRQKTLGPGETVVLDEFDLAQFNYLRQPGQYYKNQPGRYLMYAVHGNGIRSNSFRFEITWNFDAEPDFVGRLLPLVHDDWILVANSNFQGEIHPGNNFSKVGGFPVRFQCSPTGSIRDLSHVWLYLTKTRAEPLETPIEQHFLPETNYLGQVGKHHLYTHVDEKSQERWPDVLDQVRKALRRHTDEEQYLEVLRDFKQLIEQEDKLLKKHKSETEEPAPEARRPNKNPISLLTQKLGESHGLWMNGIYPRIELPESATPREVLAEAVKVHGFGKGKIEKYRVIDARKGITFAGLFPQHEYIAVQIESDQGNKILLMYFEGGTKHWWTRFYDTPTVEWGKTDKAVQISLSSKKSAWAANETPEFKLRVRNTGEKDIQFIPHIGLCRVEWDGTWYVWGSPVAWGGPATVVPPGTTVDSRLPLKLVHDDPQGWITEKGKVPLELKPGKHTIRVGLECEAGPKPISQPLVVTIAEAVDNEHAK